MMSMAEPIEHLRVKIFADGADIAGMRRMAARPYIRGFTTNPTLMHKAGVRDYRAFAMEVLAAVTDRPISFEVLSDDFAEMNRQAREMARWAPNVYVKIPVTDTKGRPSEALVRELSQDGIKVNVTAVMTVDQLRWIAGALRGGTPAYVSVFAGRIADTGRDPLPLMRQAVQLLKTVPHSELIWASPRELLNVFQADEVGCHVITVTLDILEKLPHAGRDLSDFSLETVRMFDRDAKASGLTL